MSNNQMAEDQPITEKQLSTLSLSALIRFAIDCAKHVIYQFSKRYPEDTRPLAAIEAAEAFIQQTGSVTACRQAAFKAHQAARMAKEETAIKAARACGHAAATAHVRRHAWIALGYALKAAENPFQEAHWQRCRLWSLIETKEP